MEPNNQNGYNGSGTHSPPHSPPQSPPLSGSEGSSRPGGKSGSAAGSASELGSDVKKAAQARAEEGADTAKRTLSSTASHSAEALGCAADSLRDQGEETLAQATTSVASVLSDYAERIDKRTAEDLMQDAVGLARRNPTLFVLGSVGLGLALSRFFKASSGSSGELSGRQPGGSSGEPSGGNS